MWEGGREIEGEGGREGGRERGREGGREGGRVGANSHVGKIYCVKVQYENRRRNWILRH